jgi:hypothetical protein
LAGTTTRWAFSSTLWLYWACPMAPVIMVNQEFHGRLTSTVAKLLRDAKRLRTRDACGRTILGAV